MSKGETTMVRDLDVVNPTVIRPQAIFCVFGWGSVSIKVAIKKICAGLCNRGCCSASCRVGDGLHAKRSGIGLFDGGSVEVVLVVSGCRHDKEAVGKVGAAFEVCNDMRD